MENDYEPLHHEKQNVSTTLSMFPPNSTSPESTSSAPPPAYSNPSQYPPTSGMPYPQQYLNPIPVMGYPQPYASPPGGQPYYPQPGVVYPGPPGPNYQVPLSQQQQQVFVVNNQPNGVAPVYVVGAQPISMVGAIVLSCFAYWCCGMVFGGIAFILAMVGQSSAAAGDTLGALRLRNASIALSIVGIVVTIVIIVVAASVAGSAARYYYSYNYCRYYGTYSSNYYYCK